MHCNNHTQRERFIHEDDDSSKEWWAGDEWKKMKRGIEKLGAIVFYFVPKI